MNKITKIFTYVALSGVLLVSAGCFGGSVEPPKEPKEMMEDAFEGMQSADSYSYKLALEGDLQGPEGGVPQNIKFNGTLSGILNAVDKANPAFSLAVDGSALLDSDPEQKLMAELRFVDKVVYAKLTTLPLPEGSVPAELEAAFLNQWWSYPLPPEIAEELSILGKKGEGMTEEQKKIQELFAKHNFLQPEYLGNESVNGVDSFKYKVDFDETAFVSFVEAVSNDKGEPLSETDKTELLDSMEVIDVSGFVYIAGGDMPYFTKFEGLVSIDAKEESVKGELKFVWSNADMNKALKVDVPKDAQPFSPLVLAGLGLLGGQDITTDVEGTESEAAELEELPEKVSVKKP